MLQKCSNIDISASWFTGGTGGYVSISFCLKFRYKLYYFRVTEFSCKAKKKTLMAEYINFSSLIPGLLGLIL